MQDSYGTDTLTVPLLDKDGILPALPPPSDSGYFIQKPSENQFHAAANEILVVPQQCSQGSCTPATPVCMWMLECIIRPELECMTEWYIGIQHHFQVTAGAHGKYFKKYLPDQLYAMLVKTYSDGDYDHLWDAVFTMCELFGVLGREVAEALGYTYRADWEEGTLAYLRGMRNGKFQIEQSTHK